MASPQPFLHPVVSRLDNSRDDDDDDVDGGGGDDGVCFVDSLLGAQVTYGIFGLHIPM